MMFKLNKDKLAKIFFLFLITILIYSCGSYENNSESGGKVANNREVVNSSKSSSESYLYSYIANVNLFSGDIQFQIVSGSEKMQKNRRNRYAVDESTLNLSGSASWDSINNILGGNVVITNNSSSNLYSLVIRITQYDPWVSVLNPSFLDEDGNPCFNYCTLPANSSSSPVEWQFHDPSALDFTFSGDVYAEMFNSWSVNDSYQTSCAEEDNINIPLKALQVNTFRITASHPSYSFDSDNCTEDFSGCGNGGATNLLAQSTENAEDACYTLYDNGIVVVQSCTVSNWWRPYSMDISVGNSSPVSGHYLVLYHKLSGQFSWPQFFVIYEDGNVRMKPHPKTGQSDVCFGSSVIIGPALPDTRPFVDIESVNVTPSPLTVDITYRNGGTSHIDLSVNQTEAIAEVSVGYDTNSSFATFRSMWVADGNSDCDHIQTQDKDLSIIGNWTCLRGPSWLFKRSVISQHNTSAPDIKIEVIN